MSKFGSNSFVKLEDLLKGPGPQVATVFAMNSDGTATITRRGGGKVRIRAPQAFTAGDQVVVQSGVAIGKAPTLSTSSVSI
jgi:hypothetical protein